MQSFHSFSSQRSLRKILPGGGGIYSTAVGYAAGRTPNPTYEEFKSMSESSYTHKTQVIRDSELWHFRVHPMLTLKNMSFGPLINVDLLSLAGMLLRSDWSHRSCSSCHIAARSQGWHEELLSQESIEGVM